jgi:hypothetical protein
MIAAGNGTPRKVLRAQAKFRKILLPRDSVLLPAS